MKKTCFRELITIPLFGILLLCLSLGISPAIVSQAKAGATASTGQSTSKDHEDDTIIYVLPHTETDFFSWPYKNIKITSSDEKVVTIETKEENGMFEFYAKSHKIGMSHCTVKIKGEEEFCILIIVSNAVEPTMKNINIKAGTTYDTIILSRVFCEKNKVVSDNPDVAIGKILSDTLELTSGSKLRITAKKPGTATLTIKNEHNTGFAKIKVTVTKKDPSTPVVEPTGKKRALLIGQQYSGENTLTACPKDATAMEYACKDSGYCTRKLVDASKKQIKKAIKETFQGAKKNDVSLFYFNGHGGAGGYFCSVEGPDQYDINFISYKELAKWLSEIPGKVIVIVDCCYSGSAIDKEIDGIEFQIANQNQAVIDAFCEAEATAKGGPLSQKKFTVLTATTKDQYGWATANYCFFTRSVIQGAGYHFTNGKKLSKAPSDINKDNKVTAEEVYQYARQNAYPEMQQAQCYPAHSGMKIFQR